MAAATRSTTKQANGAALLSGRNFVRDDSMEMWLCYCPELRAASPAQDPAIFNTRPKMQQN
eukprot:1028848-Rhodomonas_salina.2